MSSSTMMYIALSAFTAVHGHGSKYQKHKLSFPVISEQIRGEICRDDRTQRRNMEREELRGENRSSSTHFKTEHI